MGLLSSHFVDPAFADSILALRGRGLAKLIEGLSAGDPISWTIVVGAVVIFGGIAAYKHYNSD